MPTDRELAVIAGVGPGLGTALVRCFAQAGMRVACVARNAERLAVLTQETGAQAYACDITDENSVERLFTRVGKEQGAPSLVVHNPSWFVMKPFLELEQADVIEAWRIACFGGILFTGSTPSIKPGSGFAAFAAAKFGVRALAQSMARELGSQGIHVAHVV